MYILARPAASTKDNSTLTKSGLSSEILEDLICWKENLKIIVDTTGDHAAESQVDKLRVYVEKTENRRATTRLFTSTFSRLAEKTTRKQRDRVEMI